MADRLAVKLAAFDGLILARLSAGQRGTCICSFPHKGIRSQFRVVERGGALVLLTNYFKYRSSKDISEKAWSQADIDAEGDAFYVLTLVVAGNKPPLGPSRLRACPGCGKEFYWEPDGFDRCDACVDEQGREDAAVSRYRVGGVAPSERYP